jgi:hypothetical protein
MSRRRTAAATALLAATAAAGCASGPPDTPPERPLYRLPVAEWTLPPAVGGVVVEEPPSGPPVPGLRIALRFVRADGTAAVAPTFTTYDGQRGRIQLLDQISYVSDFDVEVAKESVVAEPVVATLHGGLDLELVGAPCGPGTDEIALAFSARQTDVRRPIEAQTLGPLAPGTQPVTIQTPRSESVDFTCARRLAPGREVALAVLPDPAGKGSATVFVRVDRVEVPGPAESETNAGTADTPPPVASAPEGPDLAAMAAAAAQGPAAGTLRVVALRVPAGTDALDALRGPTALGPGSPIETLATLAVETSPIAGVRAAGLLHEAYVQSWDAAGRSAADPVVATHESGLSAEIGADGDLHLRWTTTPRWTHFTIEAAPDLRSTVLVPNSKTLQWRVPLPGDARVLPVARLEDGSTAALILEFAPAR